MDFQRVLLFIALSFTLLMIYEAWQNDYVRPQQPPPNSTATASTAIGDRPDTSSLPGRPDTPASTTALLESVARVTIDTDLYHIELDTRGGDLRYLELKHYPISPEDPDNLVTLMNDASPIFIAQSGLLATSGNHAPDHHADYRVEQSHFKMDQNSDTLTVPLTWQHDSGLTVTKSYIFHRDSYLIDVTFHIDNQSADPWGGFLYQQLQRQRPQEGGNAFIYTYTGGVIYSPEEKYEKISFDDMDKIALQRTIQQGWLAMIQHYFLGAWLPATEEPYQYYSKKASGGRYILGAIGTQQSLAAGESLELTSRLFVGPKLTHQLEEAAEGLELSVDYGILTILAKPLFWMLELIQSFVGNWGWSIILLTILIKLAFYKLSETSYRSMAQLRKFQPKLQALKERYGDDRQAMNQAMMKIYKEEKINPLGGCLPILIQIPVFIALYWMLLESVEMRQAPFMLWIQDLSAADPYFVLPLLMGVTMIIQQKLNPAPLDPIQAKVMMALPIIFTVFFIFFPAGLVLYWVVNNALSIAQQWYITRVVIKEK
ncbi:membrane protein insertase YidC [Ectothiorhodospiraceae bacterium BW-2]|nr:membrane protein insertase YidC [Ectothiorhodospiraceae bacterium BW-2]